MVLVGAVIMFFLVIGFIGAMCNSLNSKRHRYERLVDLLVAIVLVVMLFMMNYYWRY